MNASLDALEFERLKALLARYVSTEDGRALLAALAPSMHPGELETEHGLVAEAMEYLRIQRVPFREVPLLTPAMEKLQVTGSRLEIEEIEAVQVFLGQLEGLRIRWKDEAEAFPSLAKKSARLPDLRDLAKRLGQAVHDGEVDDRYSPELARIRRALETTRSRVTSKLESMLRSPDYASQLQDQLVTVRNGRFVIPVRTDQKRGVEGIIHGTSSSGATVFMEPLAVLELNNELVRLHEAEFQEVARILTELTELIQKSAFQLTSGRALHSEIEVVFAKARFGRDFDCRRPVFSARGLLSLVKARHPLLEDNLKNEGRQISPVSLDLDSTRRILVISGPNAGGKTVVLKTVGLLALMAQSGIPVPADEATVPVFDQVLADIGDQQSIANHLSTFSAHVLSIKSMLESATAQSLILLDEIGSSTEPGEGAALAKAVLERFREIRCLAIATTHYNRLKVYAETTKDVSNAAMEFNEQTLEPTFRLIHGLAGASSGLKIAERLRMPVSVLRDAIGFLDTGEADVALYVDELRRRIADLESEKAAVEAQRKEFESRKEQELASLKTQQREELARAERRVQEIAKEMTERAARELETVQDESLKKKYQRKLEATTAHATSQIRQEKEKVADRPARPAVTPKSPARLPVEVGSRVRVDSLGVAGVVISFDRWIFRCVQGDDSRRSDSPDGVGESAHSPVRRSEEWPWRGRDLGCPRVCSECRRTWRFAEGKLPERDGSHRSCASAAIRSGCQQPHRLAIRWRSVNVPTHRRSGGDPVSKRRRADLRKRSGIQQLLNTRS
jgi:DNA mismatch repair protein MutS2